MFYPKMRHFKKILAITLTVPLPVTLSLPITFLTVRSCIRALVSSSGVRVVPTGQIIHVLHLVHWSRFLNSNFLFFEGKSQNCPCFFMCFLGNAEKTHIRAKWYCSWNSSALTIINDLYKVSGFPTLLKNSRYFLYKYGTLKRRKHQSDKATS